MAINRTFEKHNNILIAHRILQNIKKGEKKLNKEPFSIKDILTGLLLFLGQFRQDLQTLEIHEGFTKCKRISTHRKRVPDTAAVSLL